MSSEDDSFSGNTPPDTIIENCDDQTLRIMVSTDNHLGYLEDDPIRGDDSFAAMEEVLFLARKYSCDMVLLAGDLFHDNKPSRLTMFKAINIFRRYCMGKNPVSIQILSDQKKNFRRGVVNYQDEFYSVDLPVMSIHGNHDSPASEGTQGSHLLAALDLMDSVNLINYIGQQENNKEVEVSPVLFKKGNTRIALYGLGSMREERLNRLWQTAKFNFLRPVGDHEGGDDDQQWFNIFALHQNRDKGRGSKNCVHETMIPEWMDFVIWGHEHESLIEESVVGTFRISQPGSSVATSLVAGESVRKKIGLLDVRGTNFRLRSIPLTQVRTFALGEVSLAAYHGLDPDDPKVEEKVKQVLKEEVELLIHQAKQKARDLLNEARKNGNIVAGSTGYPLENCLRKPQEVLIRLKVEHSGFSAVNNQRFGAGFVGEIANTNDILLFQRRKAQPTRSSKKKSSSTSGPIVPDTIEEMNIEDFIVGELDADNHLDIFDETRMAAALDDYVSKEQTQAINDSVSKLLQKQQTKLMKQRPGHNAEEGFKGENEELPILKKSRKKQACADDAEVGSVSADGILTNTQASHTKPSMGASVNSVDSDFSVSKNHSPLGPLKPPAAKRNRARVDDNGDGLKDDIKPTSLASISGRGRAAPKKTDYTEDDSGDSIVEGTPNPPVRKKTTSGMRTRRFDESVQQPSRKTLSQPKLSFIPVVRNGKGSSVKRKRVIHSFGSADDEGPDECITGYDVDEDWGTANTDSFE